MTAQQPPRQAQGIALQVQQLDRQFGPLRVLNHLDLQVPAGQFIAVVGRSGCGKSTLLRLLAGLDQPDAGVLLADDQPLQQQREEPLGTSQRAATLELAREHRQKPSTPARLPPRRGSRRSSSRRAGRSRCSPRRSSSVPS